MAERTSKAANDKFNNKSSNLSVIKEFEHIADKAIDLIFNNKINAKNAFDVNVEFLENLPTLLGKNEETGWQKASASLDASAKIYGYRVDSVHSETFRFLGGLNRADKKEDGANNDANGDDREGDDRPKRKPANKQNGFNTIETDHSKLNITTYDLEFDVDPLFKITTAKFNESGAKGLLLNSLPLDANLNVILEGKRKIETNKQSEEHKIDEDVNDFLKNFWKNQHINNYGLCPELEYFNKDGDKDFKFKAEVGLINDIDDADLDNYNEEEALNNEKLEYLSNRSMMSEFNVADDQNYQASPSRSNSLMDRDSPNFNSLSMNNNLRDEPRFNTTFNFVNFEDEGLGIISFGDGNKNVFKNLERQFVNKFDTFGQKMIKANKTKRAKKEEKLFDFSEDNPIERFDIFEKAPKKTKRKDNNTKFNKPKRRKIKEYYHYDPLSLLHLFTIPEKQININKSNYKQAFNNNNNINNDVHNENNDYFHNDLDNNNDYNAADDDNNFNDSFNDFNPVLNTSRVEQLNKNEELEKKLGRLYKTVDVRLLKSKIWESLSNNNRNNLNNSALIKQKVVANKDFTTIIKDVNYLVKTGENNSEKVSSSTCFVCLLHLSNEKNLNLEMIDEFNFMVKTN